MLQRSAGEEIPTRKLIHGTRRPADHGETWRRVSWYILLDRKKSTCPYDRHFGPFGDKRGFQSFGCCGRAVRSTIKCDHSNRSLYLGLSRGVFYLAEIGREMAVKHPRVL